MEFDLEAAQPILTAVLLVVGLVFVVAKFGFKLDSLFGIPINVGTSDCCDDRDADDWRSNWLDDDPVD